ncbi:hypothetical protein ACIBCN_31515 [Nocardia sp. NPDC051052]|uniref:hypothetical protein n=1 Tax=Nocardia sp. NPDC051052 TaxID=3364322 RepID=UPI0037AC440B
MAKNVWVGLQIVGMVLVVASAQAVIRLLIDHSKSQVWGLLDWAPGGWGGQIVVLVVLAAAGAILADRSNNKVKLLEA